MTVAELIKELQELPQDLPVYGEDNDVGDIYRLTCVEVSTWLLAGEDTDLIIIS